MGIRWQKSSFSEHPEGNCLELASSCDGGILMRESDDPGTVVGLTPESLRAFLADAKVGRCRDLP